MEKEKIYIDLGKCSADQRNHIFSLLPDPENPMQCRLFWKFKYLHFSSDLKKWIVQSGTENKTELTYPEFIKLFEGGEGEKYDLEALAEESVNEVHPDNSDYLFREVYKEFFKEGFKKAMELNSNQ